jgi:endoglycosylceramidase
MILGCLALLAAACGESQTQAPSRQSGVPALLPLHATRGEQPGIFDSEGRQVLLRGVNLNALGDYYQPNPAYPSVIPLHDTDFPRMAQQGFNVVRLILSWSLLEPARGQISAEYLQRIHAAVDAAKANGIYVVLDMHQDAWGKYIATPPGVTCPAGLERAVGWDGAPEWATITDGKSTCRTPGVRELAAAVRQAFASFYSDRDGIQTQLINAWAAVVSEFAREPAVAGYDLINEPHFGNNFLDPAPQLAAFYTRLVPAIRTVEQQAGGDSHIVFFEPIPTWPSSGTAPAADFTADENIVFAPHNYVESLTSFGAAKTIEDGFAIAAQDAATYGVTFWIGEYGWFGDPSINKAKVIRYARAEDERLVSGTWWQWHQACGDPHTIGMDGGQPPAELIHFNRTFCPGDVDGGAVPEWAVVLSRPYPRAAPGHLVSLQSDGDAATLRLSGVADGAAPAATLDLWVPDRGAGRPVISGTGVGAPRIIDVSGGFRVLVDVSGHYTVAAGPAAGSGSMVRSPLGRCGVPSSTDCY